MKHENNEYKNMAGYLKPRLPLQPHKKYTTDFTKVHTEPTWNLSPWRRRMEPAQKSRGLLLEA